jgi:predicted DNA-binding mobile mystery protein A
MSARELGDRLGVSDEAVLELERSEVAGGARLRSLQKAAAAMDCTFVYGFLPNGSLDGIVRERAAEVVADDLARVRHSMALEDQAVTPGGPEEDELIQRVAETRGLWSR